MTLTSGRGPLSPDPAGRFHPPVAPGTVFVEPYPRHVRGVLGGSTVVDSERVLLVHRAGHPPAYAFPIGDVHGVTAEPEPEASGYVQVAWAGVDHWYEEDEEVFLHVRNPFHRVDCVRTHRRLHVEVAGATVVDTTGVLVLYETSLAPKLYVERSVVRCELVPSATTTYCPYKGTATYLDAVVADTVVADVAWTYEDPLPESFPIRGLVSFEPTIATVTHDLPAPVALDR